MHEIIGVINRIFDVKQVSPTKQYRTFWLKTREENPQYIRMQFQDEDCALLDKLELEDKVRVFFSISGKPKLKYDKLEIYNNIMAKTIELI